MWGDWLKFGTKPNSTKDNYGEWMDLYIQSVLCRNGHYGFTDLDTGSFGPHSDFTQAAEGGFANAYIGKVDVRWYYQTFFLKGTNIIDDRCMPDGRTLYSRVMFRAMPASTTVYGGNGHGGTFRYLQCTGQNSSASAGEGNYYAVEFSQVYAERGGPNPNTLQSYFGPNSTPGGSITVSGNRCTFPTYRHADRARPIYTGHVDFVEPSTPVVTASEVGHALRVTTAGRLRQVLG